MFGFEDRFAMFDVTPLENQFILEYMPDAKGDYVKVYLYGLMQCYHPQKDMSLTKMAHELNMTEDEITRAFRHWELRNLVRRVLQDPPVWQYVNVKQQMIMRGSLQVDEAYTSFAEAVYTLFGNDRKVESRDIALAYEWVEELGLPGEVVLMMLRYCMETRGKHFKFISVQKLATRLSEESVCSIEDAEAFFQRDRDVFDGAKKVLRRLGKRRDPSEDEQNLYALWIREWGFSEASVLAACSETVKGEPNFAYLGGILNGLRTRNNNQGMKTAEEVEASRNESRENAEPLRKLFDIMRIPGVTINEGTLAVYKDMRRLYPDDVIQMAGRECAAHRRSTLDDVTKLLESWSKRGLKDPNDVQMYLDQYRAEMSFFNELYTRWGITGNVSENDRAMLRKWRDEWRLPQELILRCAEEASGADNKLVYLNAVLGKCFESGVVSVAAFETQNREWKEKKKAEPSAAPVRSEKKKVVAEQQYTQREYENPTGLPDWMKKRLEAAEKKDV